MNIKTKADRVIDVIIYLVMVLIIIISIYPIWYVVVASLSSNDAVASGQVVCWVKDFTLESYKSVLDTKGIWVSYGNTLFYSFFGTLVNMFLTVTCAYALSKKWLFGRKFFTLFIMLSMWFGAGMIANFINYRELGLINNRWGMLLLGAVSAYNVILMRSFFESIPVSLDESARLDGANEFTILLKIYLPLSTAALMTISLYYFVGHWNAYFWSMILLQDESKLPLQVLLQKLVVKMDAMNNAGGAMDYTVVSRETVVYATMVVAILPMLVVYPFVQKFFVKGVMIGAVKG